MKKHIYFSIGFIIGVMVFNLFIMSIVKPYDIISTIDIPTTPLKVFREADGVMYSKDLLVRYTNTDIDCLTANIFFEGRNQTIEGQKRIAKTVIIRLNDIRFKASICGVITAGKYVNGKVVKNKCHYSWFCDGLTDRPNLNNVLEHRAWGVSQEIAQGMLSGELTHDSIATHYHTLKSSPYWKDSPKMVYLDKEDGHLFYLEI